MARIMMKTAPTNTVEELYPSFLSAAAARGVKDKTLDTYKQHFRAISKRLLLNTVNEGCIVVSGKASLFRSGEHAWNIVKVNGQAYQLDTTWDMANTKDGLVNYDYFNLTDEAISADHVDFPGVPVCTATDTNYFEMNGLYFESMRHLERYLLHGIQNGQTDFYFKIADEGHKMADIIMAVRNFILAEASN